MNITEKVYQVLTQLNTEYFTAKQLRGIFCVASSAERKALNDALTTLADENKLVFDERNHRYRLAKEDEFGTAVFNANERGFGFLLCEDGDLFVPASKTHGAFNKDTVKYHRIVGTKDEAEIVGIVQRGTTQIVGIYDKSNNARFVIPDDAKFISDVYILPKRDMCARHGQKVVVNILYYPQDNRNNPEGEIVQILGYPNQNNVDMLSVAYAFGLDKEFPDEVEKYASKLPQQVTQDDIVGRVDLRNTLTYTIDGEDAKDLDDAVSVADNGDGTFTLRVSIADVSHYVIPSGAIDKEAFARGTSVYFPQTVFPMLPTSLSNGICSLYQGVDRLTLTCQMVIDGNGNVVDYDIYQSVINSNKRLTYTQVQGVFDGEKACFDGLGDVADNLLVAKRLAEILLNKRTKRGCVDFDTKEVSFAYDDDGNVVDVVPFVRNFAHQVIEEFMIVANETVAEYAQSIGLPYVYRTHDKPDREKYDILVALMRGVGINVKQSQQIYSTVLQDALLQAKDTPYYGLISDVMLRTMQKAKYSTANTGHFGLASRCYCHFTSPIRRYPDLVVHRILSTALSGKMTDKSLRAYEDMASDCARQANIREKLADEAERKADDVKKCQYAKRIVGQVFDAIISGVTERGIFCELPNTVEGFVSVDKLGEYLDYDAQRFCLFNPAVKYSLGDKVTIRVSSVNMQACKIDFDLVVDDKSN